MVAAGGEGTCCVVTRVTRVDHAFRLEVAAGRLSALAAVGSVLLIGRQSAAHQPLSGKWPQATAPLSGQFVLPNRSRQWHSKNFLS